MQGRAVQGSATEDGGGSNGAHRHSAATAASTSSLSLSLVRARVSVCCLFSSPSSGLPLRCPSVATGQGGEPIPHACKQRTPHHTPHTLSSLLCSICPFARCAPRAAASASASLRFSWLATAWVNTQEWLATGRERASNQQAGMFAMDDDSTCVSIGAFVCRADCSGSQCLTASLHG
jgi:hypothetical protein